MLDTELGIDDAKELPDIKVIRRYNKDDVSRVNLKNKRILIVVGENRGIDDGCLIEFASAHNAAIYVNHLSNMRNNYTVEGNLLLTLISQSEFDENYSPDVLITIGGQTGDYPLYHKLSEGTTNFEHWRICQSGDIVDTYDRLTRVFECSYDEFFGNIQGNANTHEYYDLWTASISKLKTEIDIPLSNMYAAQRLHKLIPENSIMHFAILNSLRVWNLFELKNIVRCFSNVGAFGIDGGLSTFLGQSICTEELCYMIIGDLAFFYDMNSLGIRYIKNNIRVILVNNNGGIEFKYGASAEQSKKIDRYIAASDHFKNAEGWALVNGFEYYAVHTKDELDVIVPKLTSKSEKPILTEIFTTDENESMAMSLLKRNNDTRSFSVKVASRVKKELKKLI